MRQALTILLLFTTINTLRAQFIEEVLEYVPAPGQLINSPPWGVPSAAESLIGGLDGGLSLGAFGGYVVFRFETPVENHPENPYGVDFTIFGNASQSWSEPGTVWVMADDNANGLADDTWYELAGSDHYFTNARRGYAVTYSDPGQPSAADVPWVDNLGHTGLIRVTAGHDQPYYPLPDSFPAAAQGNYTLSGSFIAAVVDSTLPVFIESARRAFGFADNRPRGNPPYTLPDNPYTPALENSGGDAFDLDWAVDAEGNYVDLAMVHFLKVQSAVMADGGWLGELSPEITGAVDVPPDPSLSGPADMIVIRDLPPVITAATCQLEAFVFHGGRLQSGRELLWTANMPGAGVNDSLVLTVTHSGELQLTAQLADDPQVTATVTATVDLSSSVPSQDRLPGNLILHPNPASSFLSLRGMGSKKGNITVYNSSGSEVLMADNCREGHILDVSSLRGGLYILQVITDEGARVMKFIKK